MTCWAMFQLSLTKGIRFVNGGAFAYHDVNWQAISGLEMTAPPAFASSSSSSRATLRE
jgi:hypothetical protein